MALPLNGPFRRYNPAAWKGYPMVAIDQHSVGRATFAETRVLPTGNPIKVFHVHCGPPAPLPRPATAEEFRQAVLEWLSR